MVSKSACVSLYHSAGAMCEKRLEAGSTCHAVFNLLHAYPGLTWSCGSFRFYSSALYTPHCVYVIGEALCYMLFELPPHNAG